MSIGKLKVGRSLGHLKILFISENQDGKAMFILTFAFQESS